MQIALSSIESPLGEIAFAATRDGLCALELKFTKDELRARVCARRPDAEFREDALEEIAAKLRAYFGGDLSAIDGIPVDLCGTDFQKEVWAALRRIPAGTTWTYSELAREVGRPKAMRAVGAANGQNPVALVVPCHRVVAMGGKLGGYAGGLDLKAWLLRHEGARLA